jgi:hypothetical protein
MTNLTLLKQLQQERSRIVARVKRLDAAVAALRVSTKGGTGRKHRLSASAIARIRAAQKARWAKWKNEHKAA